MNQINKILVPIFAVIFLVALVFWGSASHQPVLLSSVRSLWNNTFFKQFAPAPSFQCFNSVLIDPNGANIQSNPLVDGRYVVWVEQSSYISPSSIVYYDLGVDKKFGTSDDGGKFTVNSPYQTNLKPKLHWNNILWLANSGLGNQLFEHILGCKIGTNCATSPDDLITPTSQYGFHAADEEGTLIAFSKSKWTDPGRSEVRLYESGSHITTNITNQNALVTSISIDRNFVAFNREAGYPSSDIYAYDIQRGQLRNVTQTPNTFEQLPSLTSEEIGKSILSYSDGNLHVSRVISYSTGIQVESLYTILNAFIGSGKIYYDSGSVANFHEVPYISSVPPHYGDQTEDQYLRKYNLGSGQFEDVRVRTPYSIDMSGDVSENNVVTMSGDPQTNGKIVISHCEPVN